MLEFGSLTLREQAGPTARSGRCLAFFPPRADFDDTATYSAVATNVHGQASTNAAVVVRSESAVLRGWGAVSPPSVLFLRRDRLTVLQDSEVTRNRSIPWGSRSVVS